MKNKLQKPYVWLLILLVGFPQISETIYTPSLPELTSLLHTTGNKVQQTLSIYFIGFSLGVLLWGILCDKIGRRSSMLFGISIYIVGSLACFLASKIEVLLFARFIQALGASAGSIVTQTVMRDIYDDRKRPQVFAKISAVLAFSPAIGPFLGGTIAEYGSVGCVFLSLVFIGVMAIVLTYIGLNETRPSLFHQKSVLSVANRMLRDQKIWIYASLIGIINGIIFSYYAEMPFIFLNQLGFSSMQYGLVGLIVALGTFLGAIICKKISPKMESTNVMSIGYLILFIGLILFLIINYLELNPYYSAIGFSCSIFFIMCGIAVSLPPCLSNALLDYKDSLGISGAFLGLLYYLIVSFITEGMSLLHNGNIATLPYYLLGLTACLMLLTIGLKCENRK